TPPGVALHAAANAGPVVSGTADGIAPGPGAPLPPGPALGTGPASLTGQVPPYTVRSGLGFGLSTDSPAPWPR
ncbi:MAG TPA: hypothetical protein VNM66_08040, partial [Thermodesulfobacteriota bacterium]|nr:hypothetical protein [Thermodesulfobacteriota bacterium]